MQTMGKIQSEAAQTGSKKGNVLNIIIQVLIAALTALSGVFAGCSLAVCTSSARIRQPTVAKCNRTSPSRRPKSGGADFF